MHGGVRGAFAPPLSPNSLSENFILQSKYFLPKTQNLGLDIRPFGKFRGKIKILRTGIISSVGNLQLYVGEIATS